MAFPWTQHQPPWDWRNESCRWRNWFGKQLVTGDLPMPVPERDSGGLGAGWRCSLGRGQRALPPSLNQPQAHTMGLALKITQVPPHSISGFSQVPQTLGPVASLQHRWVREQEDLKGIVGPNSSCLRESFSCWSCGKQGSLPTPQLCPSGTFQPWVGHISSGLYLPARLMTIFV